MRQPHDPQDQSAALRALDVPGIYCILEGRDATYYDERLDDYYRQADTTGEQYARWLRVRRMFGYQPSARYNGHTLYKLFFFFDDPAKLAPCRRVLEPHYRFVLQERFGASLGCGEIISTRHNKGDGVRRVTAYYGLSMADTFGFGDSMNDLEMMQAVGIGVGMAEGSEALKPYCTLIAPPESAGGLAAVLRSMR